MEIEKLAKMMVDNPNFAIECIIASYDSVEEGFIELMIYMFNNAQKYGTYIFRDENFLSLQVCNMHACCHDSSSIYYGVSDNFNSKSYSRAKNIPFHININETNPDLLITYFEEMCKEALHKYYLK